MTSIGHHNHFNTFCRDKQICRKIAVAIKNSKVFQDIQPINLLKEKLGIRIIQFNSDECIPHKKLRIQNDIHEEAKVKTNTGDSATNEISFLPTGDHMSIMNNQKEISNPALNSSYGLLPSPESLFDDDPKESDNNSVKSENRGPEFAISSEKHTNIFQEEYLKNKNIIFEKLCDDSKTNDIITLLVTEKNKNDKLREKYNKNLLSLAASLLPVPSKLYDKDLLISALENEDNSSFINLFKEAITLENQISSEDLSEIISAIIKRNVVSILPEFCNCLEYTPYYSNALSESFIKYHIEMVDYKNNILNCLLTMIDVDVSTTVISFIEACFCVNDWNQMWSGVLTKDPTYKFEEKYFKACMSSFQNLTNNSTAINHDTMIIIISYIMRNYYDHYDMYMADIWLYCVLTTDITAETDLKVPQQILDRVIEKLILMKNPSFLFIMKLLSKNWSLLCNNTFCVWFSDLISDKSDVKKCLSSVKESIESMYQTKEELNNSFLLLSINVMSVLNKKSLFTCSKNIYDTFLQSKLNKLKTLIVSHNERFKYKWIIVECLISSTEYQSALDILKEFDVLKDLEITFIEYSRVKDILPNLVWHLLSIPNMLPVIDLFEQVVSIFIFNENNDSSYTKNCNEIFDLIVVKAFESNDKEVVLKMLLLLDHILSADIEFNISKECLRYLLVAAVRTDIPFNDLLDFIDLCFKFEIFETIQTAADGFGSFVEVYSNLAKEEVSILSTWLCRHVKIKLVDLAQTEGASIRENLMKVCSLKFILRPSKTSDNFIQKLGSNFSFNDLLPKFVDSLNNPKYLSHPIKFSTNIDITDEVSIICDNRIVYNAIYYSDI